MKKMMLLAVLLLMFASGAVYAEDTVQDIAPMEIREEDVDLENGDFCLQIEDTDRIIRDGYFTAALYLEDRYDPSQIESMKAGDRVRVNGEWFTISEIVTHEIPLYYEEDDGDADASEEADSLNTVICYEIYPEEVFWGYIVFEPSLEGFYYATENDWRPVTLLKKMKITLPLADTFVYHEMESGGATESPCDAKAFIEYLTHPDDDGDEEPEEPVCFFSPYNTNARFKDGQMTDIWTFSYPYGPEED